MPKAPTFKSRRYVKSIKESINDLMGNKNAIHKQLAEIIADYSHKPIVTHGDNLIDSKLEFFVVEQLLSTHFIRGFFCPSRIVEDGHHFSYEPNINRRGESRIKKLMSPFTHPHVKNRQRTYYIRQKRNEPLRHFAGLVI